MGDVGEDGRAYREWDQERRKAKLDAADPAGWTQHDTHHWSRTLAGEQMDYWPSRSKFRYQGQTMTGDVTAFIAKREVSAHVAQSASN